MGTEDDLEPASASHEALLTFLNAAPVGLVQTTLDGTVSLINGRSAMLLLPLAQPPLRRLDNLFAVLAGVAPQLPALVAGFAGVHGTVCNELRLPVPAGRTEAQRHLALTLIKLDAGRLMAVLTDITRQVHDEQALRDSEARLRFTLDAVQVGDWALDLDSGLMQRSRRFDLCLGHAGPAPDSSFAAFIEQVHADDRDELLASLQSAAATAQPWQAQCRVLWPDGSVHWLGVHGQPHPGARDGVVMQWLGVVVDTTAQHHAAAARAQAMALQAENRRIQEASQFKSQFLANMSHELRTPLNAVIGFADLLKSGHVAPGTPQHQRFLGHIGDSGRHLLQLINDVLDLSKVESGKFEFHPEPLQLTRLLKEVQDILHTAVLRQGVSLSVVVDPALHEVVLDPARLKQVLFNYLSNAIKFSPHGGRVSLRARADGADHLRIEVEDQGMGIAPADLPRLFVEFEQLDGSHSREHPGTGLGLALTRRLVQAQGGSVGVHSTPGQGSVFWLRLNRVHGHDAAQPPAEAPPVSTLPQIPPADLTDPASARRLLVIEHDPLGQARLALGLARQGFAVDTAGTGAQALAQARGTAYDAITLDLQLPDQHGLDLLADIRSTGASQASPVVGVSVPTAPGQAARFAIADLLSKPLRSDQIVAAMAQLRRGHRGHMGRMRVMVVDDDPLALDLMRAALASLDIEVLGLADADQALDRLQHWPPDALILDLLMPGTDGFALLDRLRREPRWQQLPVYVWTSLALTDDEQARLAGSARAILAKGGGAMAALLDDLRRWRQQLSEGPLARPGAAGSGPGSP